jgi:hypothetical protein
LKDFFHSLLDDRSASTYGHAPTTYCYYLFRAQMEAPLWWLGNLQQPSFLSLPIGREDEGRQPAFGPEVLRAFVHPWLRRLFLNTLIKGRLLRLRIGL